ncbi:MAG: methyltransferase domain-containing protein [Bacteroidota bacterium]
MADLGCGGGDLAKKIEKQNKNLKVLGIDANPHIVQFARKQYPEIEFETLDVFSDEFKKREYDIITATLFIHHFSDEQLIELFKSFNARVGVVINDIHRHPLSYYSIKLLTKLFSKSAMVKFDAPLSVRRAFKKKELIAILDKAGIKNYSLRWKWAFRWQLVWHNF